MNRGRSLECKRHKSLHLNRIRQNSILDRSNCLTIEAQQEGNVPRQLVSPLTQSVIKQCHIITQTLSSRRHVTDIPRRRLGVL